jgi:probable rRNA maturation factor
MEIAIDNRQKGRAIDLPALTARIQRVLEDSGCGPETELSLVITDDPDIHQLNLQYLGKDRPTNVISFPQAEGEFADLTPGLLGDVVVSVDTAWREAQENGLDPQEHLLRLIIHGILHLLGHDHLADEEQARAMEELTERRLASALTVA